MNPLIMVHLRSLTPAEGIEWLHSVGYESFTKEDDVEMSRVLRDTRPFFDAVLGPEVPGGRIPFYRSPFAGVPVRSLYALAEHLATHDPRRGIGPEEQIPVKMGEVLKMDEDQVKAEVAMVALR